MQNRLCTIGTFGVLVIAATAAQAADQITPFKSGGRTPVGTIQSMTPYVVTIEVGGNDQQVPVNNIRSIKFDGEPTRLTNVIRNGVFGGRYEDMLEELTKLEADENITNSYIKEEVDFLKAYCDAKLALASRDQTALLAAGRQMGAFVQKNPTSFRVLQASELVGDLLVAIDKADLAIQQYDMLSKAPWPDYQLRGALLKGRAWQAAGDTAKALGEFNKALGIDAGEGTESLTLEATLGKAECQAGSGDVKSAVDLVRNVVRDADAEDAALHARAYHTLGNCYRSDKDPKNAMLAYLHVHLLYRVDKQLHRSSLDNLVEVYTELEDTKRALFFQQLREATYGAQ